MIGSETLTAFHEAGHALAAELFGERTTRVEIVGDADLSGSTETLRLPSDPDDEGASQASRESVEDQLRCVLAGIVAEAMVSGRDSWDETSEDLDLAVRLAMKVVDDCEEVVPLLESIRVDLEQVLGQRWAVIEKLADALMHRKQLSGAEVRRILDEASPS